MSQVAPALLALLAMSVTRAAAAPTMDMQVSVVPAESEITSYSATSTTTDMDSETISTAPVSTIIASTLPTHSVGSSSDISSPSLNTDTTPSASITCDDCASTVPFSLSMSTPMAVPTLATMQQVTFDLPTVSQSVDLPIPSTPSADDNTITSTHDPVLPPSVEAQDTPSSTVESTEPTTTLAVLAAYDLTSSALSPLLPSSDSGRSLFVTVGPLQASSTFARLAPGIVTHSAEAADPPRSSSHSQPPVSEDAGATNSVPTTYILSGILSSLVGLVVVFYFCAVFRRHRSKHREAANNSKNGNDVLFRTLSYDKARTRVSLQSIASCDSGDSVLLHEKDNSPAWSLGAPASARISKGVSNRNSPGGWLRPSQRFPSLSVHSIRASILPRSSVFSGFWSTSNSPGSSPRVRPTVYDRVIDISKNVPGSKFSVTSSDFGDCEKRGLKSLGEIPRPDEAFCRTPPTGSVLDGMLDDALIVRENPLVRRGDSVGEEVSRTWTIYAESLDSEEGCQYVVEEASCRESELPVITFSPAEQRQRPISLIRG
ncbi:hypothetical protein HDZ31DRAFT_63065 [Schizophyllum fasciatum]